VSFNVKPGEGLAIIGPNGAGKSTILKLLTRILKPTMGACEVHGRVGALIEVAAGFHPELTGRENVYLQGAIMGMKRPEIQERFDEIVEFAGLETFVDTPVKRYSSGMNARLGFSIAAHLNPDVLIIDEILSVGDLSFQQKCIDRMSWFKARGAAIVFVSHNLQAVSTYFDRGLIMERGRCRFEGTATEAVAKYTASASEHSEAHHPHARASVVSAALLDDTGRAVTTAVPGDRLRLSVRIRYGRGNPALMFGFYVTDATTGTRLYNAIASDLGLKWRPGDDAGEVAAEFAFRVNLLKGPYHVNVWVTDMHTLECFERREPAAHLTVHEDFSAQGTTNLEVSCRLIDSSASKAENAAVQESR
jgi:lipopolysaccharide transport system ATP-binding protein